MLKKREIKNNGPFKAFLSSHLQPQWRPVVQPRNIISIFSLNKKELNNKKLTKAVKKKIVIIKQEKLTRLGTVINISYCHLLTLNNPP